MRVILHGPQRFDTTVEATVAQLGADGPVAAVTAGWRERESEIAELDEVLGGRARNLRLYERWRDIARRDPEYGAAEEARRRRIEEAQSAYAIRVDHAVRTIQELRRRGGVDEDDGVQAEALDDGIETLRAIDSQHLARSRARDAEFYDHWQPHHRPVVAAHRDEVATQMHDSVTLAIAGGHVGDLLACLHLFNVAGLLGDRPVVAWSAGAMAAAETVVLFNDHVARGSGAAEVYRRGLGLARGVVPLPHARRRLRFDDRQRMGLLARRFAPARVVVLDEGATLDLGDGTHLPPDALVVGETGRVEATA